MANRRVTSSAPRGDDAKLWAFIGVVLPILGYVIILLTKKGGSYALHYGKQGFIIGIAAIIVAAAGWILSFMPFIGSIVHWVLQIAILIIWLIGLVYSLSGEQKQVPLIGELADRL